MQNLDSKEVLVTKTSVGGGVKKLDYSSGTTDIEYSYDALNRMTEMVDGTGTSGQRHTATACPVTGSL